MNFEEFKRELEGVKLFTRFPRGFPCFGKRGLKKGRDECLRVCPFLKGRSLFECDFSGLKAFYERTR